MARDFDKPKRPKHPVSETEFELMEKVAADIKKAMTQLTPDDCQMLVDLYYNIQEHRKRFANQIFASQKDNEPVSDFVGFIYRSITRLESNIQIAMDTQSMLTRPGRWCRSIFGIGPVITSGLLAHIDNDKSPHVSSLWSFAGLNPNQKWEKHERRPWNAKLRVLCWKVGDSFVKIHNNPKDTEYGKIYKERKELEILRNETGLNAAAAKLILAEKDFRKKDTVAKKAYEAGKLPDAHVDMRARRYTTKRFLSHLWVVQYETTHGIDSAPDPWIVTHGGHDASHISRPPNWPCD